MRSPNPTRRDLLVTLGHLATLGAAATTLGGCESLLDQIRNRPMRRSLGSLAPNDPIVETYRSAVAAMKALPASDPRSWNAQAEIHFNHCPHGNWFFLPWHRAYLLYFEQICRELTGNRGFALPYWNWTCNRRIPDAFLGDGSNPLFQPNRSGVPPAALGDAVVGTGVIDAILDEPNFLLFASEASATLRPPVGYGPLEGTPHNQVHGFVGGVMGGFRSPRDPIFWMHHNMIERIWWEWNVVRGHANTNDPAWTGLSLGGMFVGPTGDPIGNVTVGLLNLAPLLSYRFDDVSITSCRPLGFTLDRFDRIALRRLLEEGGPVRLRRLDTLARSGAQQVEIGRSASQVLKLSSADAVSQATRAGSRRVLLRVLGVEQPATGDFFVRVYVNAPDADVGTGTGSPRYAGSFAFFNDPDAHHHHGGANPAFVVDLTPALERLKSLPQPGAAGELSIQLVVVPQGSEAPRQRSLRIGGLELQLVESDAPAPRPFGEAAPAR
jgi:tyrosinase